MQLRRGTPCAHQHQHQKLGGAWATSWTHGRCWHSISTRFSPRTTPARGVRPSTRTWSIDYIGTPVATIWSSVRQTPTRWMLVCSRRHTQTRPTNQTQRLKCARVRSWSCLLRALVRHVVHVDHFPTRAWQCNHRRALGPCAPPANGDAWPRFIGKSPYAPKVAPAVPAAVVAPAVVRQGNHCAGSGRPRCSAALSTKRASCLRHAGSG